ncbi:MAG: ATP-binding protein [Chloroflexota bacterium]|nr:ATP-binding protein [Chloroflexota bacterium]
MYEMAQALPTKQFFIENITRDITLEDAILDLVDNCVDSIVRVYGIDVSVNLLSPDLVVPDSLNINDRSLVAIEISKEKFKISDKCGGIDKNHAKENVFRFGRTNTAVKSTLGVYGIGMKRAVFKIGRFIEIESHTTENGFRVIIDVEKWASNDTSWDLPMEILEPASSLEESGTEITITNLTCESKLRINDGTFMKRLSKFISNTYSLFLDKFISIELNNKRIKPDFLPIGSSSDILPGYKVIETDSVSVNLFAGLASRIDNEWTSERAGWYVLCNGRVVVSADKTELTGWGRHGPTFQPKHRGFVGIAFFFSKDPASLPWTTTKRGLNQESPVYQIARKEMALLSRPVLNFINNMYPSDIVEEIPERELAEQLKPIKVTEIIDKSSKSFKSPDTKQTRERRKFISIQYKAERVDVERIKKKINQPGWGAGKVGRFTFDYYMRMELKE